MIRRLFLAFFTLVLSSVSVFAAEFSLMTPFVQILGENGLFGLLNNSVVVFAFIYLAYFFGFFNILKIALKPVFGSGHVKETNTVALMLSFIGVTGMFYMFGKDSSIDEAILLFGGSVGFLLLSLVGASLIYWAKGNEKPMGKWVWVRLLSATTFVFIVLGMYVEKMLEGTFSDFWESIYNVLYGLAGWTMLGLIVAVLLAFKGKKNSENVQAAREANHEFDPKVVETKNIMDNIQKSLTSVNNSMKKIKVEMEDFK
jgi:hypothetical protein